MKKVIAIIFGLTLVILFAFQGPGKENADLEEIYAIDIEKIENDLNDVETNYHKDNEVMDFDEWAE